MTRLHTYAATPGIGEAMGRDPCSMKSADHRALANHCPLWGMASAGEFVIFGAHSCNRELPATNARFCRRRRNCYGFLRACVGGLADS